MGGTSRGHRGSTPRDAGSLAPLPSRLPAPTSSTEATTTSLSTTTSTSTTTPPSGPPLAVEGDRNEIVEAFQFLLNCNDLGDLNVDGGFGPATLAAVEGAQETLG